MAGLRFSGFLGRKVPYIEVPYIGIRLLYTNLVNHRHQKHFEFVGIKLYERIRDYLAVHVRKTTTLLNGGESFLTSVARTSMKLLNWSRWKWSIRNRSVWHFLSTLNAVLPRVNLIQRQSHT